ncbi:Pre-mRNA splicing factor [Trinorchestia longiramus]|nr:Pre-mRNA splicing factor [Trinorchestia longiramus]
MSSEAKENTTTLNWMYKGPAGHVSREEYLLGRKVDASLDLLNQAESDKPEEPPKSSHVIEYGKTPKSSHVV